MRACMHVCTHAGRQDDLCTVCQLHHLYCPNKFQKSRSPLCVIHTPNDSTFASTVWCWSERVLAVTFVRYTLSILGGVHWCGWDSSSLGSEDVAKRVWPAKSGSGQYCQGVMTGATATVVAALGEEDTTAAAVAAARHNWCHCSSSSSHHQSAWLGMLHYSKGAGCIHIHDYE